MRTIYITPILLLLLNCNPSDTVTPVKMTVPHQDRWGIYHLNLKTQKTDVLYSSPVEIATLRLNSIADRFVFSQKINGTDNSDEEIFTLAAQGTDLRRITTNGFWDLYPAWSPDGSKIAFLTQRGSSLGIYVMNSDGSGVEPLYDSSSNEADIDWQGDRIVFTKDNSIWFMNADGSRIRQITHPPRAGEWGKANLPFGDYDPRLSPDGAKIIFERLVDDQSPYGNYDFFIADTAGSGESRLSQSGYSQGLASWSNSGLKLVYIVAAIGTAGQYDLYMMNADGSGSRNITPDYFPPQFLCHWAIFSGDDSALYFIGEWWE